jgi:hypothetical protein
MIDPLEGDRSICEMGDIIMIDSLEVRRIICEMEENHYDKSSGR